jgi:plastocyanin
MRFTKALLACSAVCASMFLPAAADERNGGGNGGDGPDRKIITVAFGAGLNTNQPGNPDNHHVIPNTIRVNVGDVVSFNVAGFHIIRVYGNGVKLSDVKLEIPDECEVNPIPPATFPPQCGAPPVPIVSPGALAVYYNGINGLVSPQPGPPFAQLSAAANRVEPVSFLAPGRYLVICAVLPHFNDKMYAWVEVRARGNSGSGGHDHD